MHLHIHNTFMRREDMPGGKELDPFMESREYDFIQEQIIPRKTWKNVLMDIGKIILAAILFAVVSSIVFCALYPYVKASILGNEDKGIAKELRESSVRPLTGVLPSFSETTVVQAPLSVENANQITIAEYEQIYKSLDRLVTTVNQSVVGVTGYVTSMDWMKNPSEMADVTSGIIIHESFDQTKLFILSRYSKIKDVNRIHVTFKSNLTVEAELYSYDKALDLAIIVVNEEQISPVERISIKVAKLSNAVRVQDGEAIIAVGSPNGYPFSREYGIVTGRMTTVNITDNQIELFNTDIQDNRYGDGFLVNFDGEIIGVITHKFKEELNANINTALSITSVRPIIKDLVDRKERSYLGIVGADVNKSISKKLNVSNGIYINEVEPQSPAFKAGIQAGDVILKIEDRIIVSMGQMSSILSSFQPGEDLTLVVKRTKKGSEDYNKELTIKAVLHKKKN